MAVHKPKSVSIMGSTYSIKFVKSVDKEDSCGSTRIDQLTIRVNNLMALDAQRETLLHELLHCCLIDCAYTVPNEKNIVDIEENIILHASPRLFQVLRDNPKVANFLLG